MLFSKRNKRAGDPTEFKIQDQVAKSIAAFLLSVQNRFASYMGARVNNLTKKAKQTYLAIFCLLFGGLSIYALIKPSHDSEKAGKSIKPDQVSVPKYYDSTGTETKEPVVSKREIIGINRFKRYMDSLSHLVRGRAVYDSILEARPGLMDSVKAIEEIYYSQTK